MSMALNQYIGTNRSAIKRFINILGQDTYTAGIGIRDEFRLKLSNIHLGLIHRKQRRKFKQVISTMQFNMTCITIHA